MDRDPDRELIEAALEEHPRGTRWFTELVSVHWDLVWTICQADLLDERAAEEATQQSFLRVHRRLGSFRFDVRFAEWMCEITRETSDRALAEHQRRTGTGGPGLPVAWVGDWIREHAGRSAKGGAGLSPRRAFARLDPQDRRLLALHSLEGLSPEDVAGAVGLEGRELARGLAAARARLAELTAPAAAAGDERAPAAGPGGEPRRGAGPLDPRELTLVRAALGRPDRERIVRATDEIERQVALEDLAVMLTRSLGEATLEFFDVMLQTYSADVRRATAGTIRGERS